MEYGLSSMRSLIRPLHALCRWRWRPLVCTCLVVAGVLLGGCATYHALPLPEHAGSAQQLSELRGIGAADVPLSMAAVERLVLLNNPDLRSARAQHEVAQAQMLQAGLLPNPSVNGSIGYLLSGVGDATAWSAGISEDLKALITLKSRRTAAKAAAAQVDASLLWQEWQTVGKARLLVVDLSEGERLLTLQQHGVELLERRSQRLRQSLHDGNTELAAASPDLAAAAEARAALDELQRRLLGQRHELAVLLGVAPDVVIPLQSPLALPPVDAAKIREDADTIQRRRPDLVALQLGYQAQEATLRAAVLAQFPTLSIGYSASQDNSRVRNGGPAITFELPIFDRNQGNIAIAKATRQQLHDEYRGRLNAAHDEIVGLLAEQAQARAQLAALQPRVREAVQQAAQADKAWQDGLIDLRSYVDLAVAAQTRQTAIITLQQALLEQQVALDTLVGTGMPISLPQDVIAP